MKTHQNAEALAEVYQQIEDLKLEAAAIVDAAKEAGENVRALKKVAKELITDSVKLAKAYENELQIDLFREAVQIHRRKGLDGSASGKRNSGRGMAADVNHLDGRGHRRAL